jgi:hypothetical protein
MGCSNSKPTQNELHDAKPNKSIPNYKPKNTEPNKPPINSTEDAVEEMITLALKICF